MSSERPTSAERMHWSQEVAHARRRYKVWLEEGKEASAMVMSGGSCFKADASMRIELFARTVQGDATYEAIDPAVRERLLGNGDVFFAVEMQPFAAYVPDADALAA